MQLLKLWKSVEPTVPIPYKNPMQLQLRGLLRARSRFPEIVENNQNAKRGWSLWKAWTCLQSRNTAWNLWKRRNRRATVATVRAPASQAGVQCMLKAPATLSAVLGIEASEPCDWA